MDEWRRVNGPWGQTKREDERRSTYDDRGFSSVKPTMRSRLGRVFKDRVGRSEAVSGHLQRLRRSLRREKERRGKHSNGEGSFRRIEALHQDFPREKRPYTEGGNGLICTDASVAARAADGLRRSGAGVLNRARTRTLKMTVVIVGVFIFCWTPYYIITMW